MREPGPKLPIVIWMFARADCFDTFAPRRVLQMSDMLSCSPSHKGSSHSLFLCESTIQKTPKVSILK